MSLVLLRYLHFISIFAVVGCLVAEYLLLEKKMTGTQIKRVFKIDGIYGFFALVIVAAGLTLWFGVGKPPEYYTENPLFHSKVGLYIIVGLLSLYPTRFFWKYRKTDESDIVEIPGTLKKVIGIELILLFIIPLLAALMAQGIGIPD